MKLSASIFIVIFILVAIFFSCNQKSNHPAKLSSADSVFIAEWKTKSVSYYKTNQDSFALLQLQIAAKYKQADQLGFWLNCYDTTIRAYRKHDSLQKAIECFTSLYQNLWREPKDSISLVTLAESNRQIAYIYYSNMEQYKKCLSFYDEGIKLIDQAHAWTAPLGVFFFKAAGNAATRSDDYQRALNYFERCYSIALLYRDTTAMLKTLNDWGIPYQEVEKFDDAERCFRQSLNLAKGVDSMEQAIDASTNLSALFLETAKLDSALKFNKKAFEYMSRWKEKEDDSQGALYGSQAAIFTAMKKYNEAAQAYSKAIELMGRSDERRRRECGKIYFQFGSMYLQQSKEQQALEKFQSSLQCFIPEFKSKNTDDLPDSEMLYDENGLLETLEGKGDAYLNIFKESASTKYLHLAIANYHSAILIINKRNKSIADESSMLKFNESSKGILAKSKTADSLLHVSTVQ